MAISGKPKRNPKESVGKTTNESEIMNFIEKGGSVPGEKNGSEAKAFTLRVREAVLNQVDEALSQHPVIKSRNTWIVNAIVEQLKREGQA